MILWKPLEWVLTVVQFHVAKAGDKGINSQSIDEYSLHIYLRYRPIHWSLYPCLVVGRHPFDPHSPSKRINNINKTNIHNNNNNNNNNSKSGRNLFREINGKVRRTIRLRKGDGPRGVRKRRMMMMRKVKKMAVWDGQSVKLLIDITTSGMFRLLLGEDAAKDFPTLCWIQVSSLIIHFTDFYRCRLCRKRQTTVKSCNVTFQR